MKYEIEKEVLQSIYEKGNLDTQYKINALFPDLFAIGAQCTGTKFRNDRGEEFVLAQPETKKFCLINLKNGCRHAEIFESEFVVEDGVYKVPAAVVDALVTKHGLKL